MGFVGAARRAEDLRVALNEMPGLEFWDQNNPDQDSTVLHCVMLPTTFRVFFPLPQALFA